MHSVFLTYFKIVGAQIKISGTITDDTISNKYYGMGYCYGSPFFLPRGRPDSDVDIP